VTYGGREQRGERQATARCLGGLERQAPGADGARHRDRRERTACRDALVFPIKLDACAGGGGARAKDGADASRRLADQEEAVAPEVIHVRIDGRDRRGHGDHGFERVAAFGQDHAAGFGSGAMRGRDNAAAISGGVKGHGGPMAYSKPSRFA
jgi:hypothetical protein